MFRSKVSRFFERVWVLENEGGKRGYSVIVSFYVGVGRIVDDDGYIDVGGYMRGIRKEKVFEAVILKVFIILCYGK